MNADKTMGAAIRRLEAALARGRKGFSSTTRMPARINPAPAAARAESVWPVSGCEVMVIIYIWQAQPCYPENREGAIRQDRNRFLAGPSSAV